MNDVCKYPSVNAPNEALDHNEDARRDKCDLRLEAGCIKHNKQCDDLDVRDRHECLFARREQRCRKRSKDDVLSPK